MAALSGGGSETAETAIEKILRIHSGGAPCPPGTVVVCEIDRVVLIDLQFRAFNSWERPLRIADPEKVVIIADHAVPAPSIDDADAHHEARGFAAEFGISRFFDVGDHGICHQVIAEQGLARPGEMLVCADSHTCAAGAFNCAARGLGPLEVLQVLCTGRTWYVVPETVRYVLSGALAPLVGAKDLFLSLAGRFGALAENRAIEFDGPGVATMSLHDRRVLATQGVELFAEFTLFPADEVTWSALGDGRDPSAACWSDAAATFHAVENVDLDAVVPQVGLPDRVVGNTANAADVGDVKVDQFFIGSCANGQLEDLAAAAALLQGRRVASGSRLLVTPASQRVHLEAARRGYLATLLEAGAVVTSPACGACFGYDLGVVGADETCLTASTRNFRGRMGSPTARVYMASAETVAASAVAGRIIDPRALDG